MKLFILGLVSASLIGVGSAEAQSGRAHYNAASSSERGYAAPAHPGHGYQVQPYQSQSYQGHAYQGQPYQGQPYYSQAYGSGYASSRAQTWYSDTGWQPGTSAITSHGYGYGYGGAGQQPPVIVAAPYQGAIYGQQTYQVQRSQPFGYVVDGYGRYPWVSYQAYGQQYGYSAPAPQPIYYQSAPVHVSQPPVHVQAPPVYVQGAQVHVTPSPVHVAPPQVDVAPPQIIYDQGYFAVPAEAAPPPPPAPPATTERPYRQERGERG